jgi:hypothetical protein
MPDDTLVVLDPKVHKELDRMKFRDFSFNTKR